MRKRAYKITLGILASRRWLEKGQTVKLLKVSDQRNRREWDVGI